MQLCDGAVDLITFGNARAFVMHILKTYPDLVDEAMDSTPEYATHIMERLEKQPVPVMFTPAECGELLSGGHSLSERSYKNTRRILLLKNVHLVTYDSAVQYLKSLDIGSPVSPAHTGEIADCTQCFTWDLKDTLQRVVGVRDLFEHCKFPTPEHQQHLFVQLQQRRPDVFANLDETHRTIFLRQTGDNYRAALKRQPTQQMSFSILNLQSLVNSPHGQFVVSSWRGGESRHLLRNHMSANFSQLEEMAREGITVRVAGADTAEHFNVVVMYVSDFSHTKEVLGRVQVTAEQGCALCDRPASTWQKPQESEDVRSLGKPRDFQVLASIGRQAEETIGLDPDKDSAAYRDWHKKHDGQTGPPLVNCLCPETCAPCTLHLHLALHRCLWKKISVVVKGRDQEDLLPEALKSIGCTYLAYQVALYFKNKKIVMMGATL